MTDPLTKTVMKINSFHSGMKAVSEIFYSRQHFPKILGMSMFCSCIGGYMMMKNRHEMRLHNQRMAYEQAWEKYNREHESQSEMYDTVLKPTALQRRMMTRSTSYTLLGTSKDDSVGRNLILSPE